MHLDLLWFGEESGTGGILTSLRVIQLPHGSQNPWLNSPGMDDEEDVVEVDEEDVWFWSCPSSCFLEVFFVFGRRSIST